MAGNILDAQIEGYNEIALIDFRIFELRDDESV